MATPAGTFAGEPTLDGTAEGGGVGDGEAASVVATDGLGEEALVAVGLEPVSQPAIASAALTAAAVTQGRGRSMAVIAGTLRPFPPRGTSSRPKPRADRHRPGRLGRRGAFRFAPQHGHQTARMAR